VKAETAAAFSCSTPDDPEFGKYHLVFTMGSWLASIMFWYHKMQLTFQMMQFCSFDTLHTIWLLLGGIKAIVGGAYDRVGVLYMFAHGKDAPFKMWAAEAASSWPFAKKLQARSSQKTANSFVYSLESRKCVFTYLNVHFLMRVDLWVCTVSDITLLYRS
jgi:hypothetical protein